MEFYDDYLDEYEDDDGTFFDDYDGSNVDERDFDGVVQMCVLPTIKQLYSYTFILLGSCLLCRFLWLCSMRLWRSGVWLHHWISTLCGVLALYSGVGNNLYIVVFLSINGYLLMQALKHFEYKHMGPIVATILITTQILFEIMLNMTAIHISMQSFHLNWNTVRGIQMVANMKIISLAFDVSKDEKKDTLKSVPNLVPYLGYVFCPSSCVLGLWIPYSEYIRSMHKPSNIVRSLLWTISNVSLALIALVVSNCLAPLLCSSQAWKWQRAYRDALVVRSSHYFISFLSQAALAINGVNWTNNTTPNAVVGYVVSRPLTIEFPRSLTSVVRNWNLPMHEWLKTYIFQSCQNYLSSYFLAVLATFLMSSLLHGLHYQIYAVLLSLACFAYAENILRSKLAVIFNACIKVSPCRKNCNFRYCDKKCRWWRSISSFYVRLVNLLFGLLSIFHLAYLGVMLSSKDEGESTLADGLLRWQKLNYLNHWIATATLVSYNLI